MENIVINCICNTTIRNSYVTLVKCGYCSKYEHAECYAIKKVDLMVPGTKHYCFQCTLDISVGRNKLKCTDYRLLYYTQNERLAIGLLRLAVTMQRRGQLDFEDLRSQFELIFNTFTNLRILRQTPDNKLKELYKIHFKGDHLTQNVDLLTPPQKTENLA